MSDKIAVVIPARNEEESLPGILDRINEYAFSEPFDKYEKKIFVVDDGSEDNTFLTAQVDGVEAARHTISLGVGGALKTGFYLAREWGADYIIMLDADGEHDPADFNRFLIPVLKGEADMVIGSRFMNGSPPLSFVRRLGIRFFTWMVNKISGYELTDITSGYRVFKTNILDKIMFPSERHWAIEMTLMAGRNGLVVKEIPIKPRKRMNGKSQFFESMTFLLYPLRAAKQILNVYL